MLVCFEGILILRFVLDFILFFVLVGNTIFEQLTTHLYLTEQINRGMNIVGRIAFILAVQSKNFSLILLKGDSDYGLIHR